MTDQRKTADNDSSQEAWLRLRGCMKNIFAELDGGETFLRQERKGFNRGSERRVAPMAQAMQEGHSWKD